MASVKQYGNQIRMFWAEVDPDTGKRKQRSRNYQGSGTKKDALSEARQLESAFRRNPIRQNGDGTIADFLDTYKPTATASVCFATRQSMLWAFDKIAAYVGETPMDKFNTLTLVTIQQRASADGIAPASQAKIFRTLKKAINVAVSWQLAPDRSALAFNTFQPLRVPKKMPPIRTIEESARLSAELRPTHPEFADMVILAAYTGMRYGEIAALGFDQCDFVRGRLTVNRTVTKSPKGYIVKMEPKTAAGFRTVPLAPEVLDMLSRRRAGVGGSLVFPNRVGEPFNPGSFSFAVTPVAQSLGLPSGIHASRHYYASLMLDRGVSLPVLSALLGHSSPKITLGTYSWCISDPSEDDAVLAALGGLSTAPESKEQWSPTQPTTA